jgi:hypothetical protein
MKMGPLVNTMVMLQRLVVVVARIGEVVASTVKHVKAAYATDTVSIIVDGANATTGIAIWDFADAALGVGGIANDAFDEDGTVDVMTAASEDAGGSKGIPC